MSERASKQSRQTSETRIELELNLDGSGQARVETGIGFFDHMLQLLARHALLDLSVSAEGDLQVDDHHTVEDVGLVLGAAFNEALGDRRGITRYGYSLLPMDDALSRVAVDLGGRPFLVYSVAMRESRIKTFDLGLVKHFWRSFAEQARCNLHIAQLYGEDVHHAYESIFKGVARSLYAACALDPRVQGVPSSKGVIGQ